MPCTNLRRFRCHINRRAFDSGLSRDFDEVVPVNYNYWYEENSCTYASKGTATGSPGSVRCGGIAATTSFPALGAVKDA